MSQKIDPRVFVIDKIKELLGISSGVNPFDNHQFRTKGFNIDIGKSTFQIKFPENDLEDFEGSSEYEKSEQFINLKNHIEFEIYVQLLHQYALPTSFRISEKLIDEKRHWQNDILFNTRYGKELNNKLNSGLKKLRKYLEVKAKALDVVALTKQEIGIIKNCLDWYEAKSTFDCNNVSSEFVSFLKAALVCELIGLEETRKETRNPKYLNEINDKINFLVDSLRDINKCFLNIELPGFIKDYASDIESKKYNPLSQDDGVVSFASNKVIFLARKFNEPESDSMKQIIENEFNKDGFTIQEGEVKDCGYVSEDILNKIKTSGFFIALITPVNELKSGKFSTSTWVLMEIGAASAFGRKIIPMVDLTVDDSEYSGKLQRDCQYELFSKDNFKDVLGKVIARVKNEYSKNDITE
jgi:hypothetical protein